ncbi:alpha/beta fold hydrolase [Actinopolymorpha pittospori]
MSEVEAGLVKVEGARLYYEVRGRGPVLLVGESGEGHARRSRDLVDQLVDTYTVVTYDRRGLSRSTPIADGPPATLSVHADDASRVLAEVTDEPALMLGLSIGAVIGFHLAVEHPGKVGTLVAFEPVAPWLLPEPLRDRHRDELREVQELYHHDGLQAAFPKVAEILGIDLASQDREPDLTPQPMTPERTRNFHHFLEHDFTAVQVDDLDPKELVRTPTRIVPAAGVATPRHVFDRQCADQLTELLGVSLTEFQGGHNANLTHPRAFAARLRGVLR